VDGVRARNVRARGYRVRGKSTSFLLDIQNWKSGSLRPVRRDDLAPVPSFGHICRRRRIIDCHRTRVHVTISVHQCSDRILSVQLVAALCV
jgi:hypothetical protein